MSTTMPPPSRRASSSSSSTAGGGSTTSAQRAVTGKRRLAAHHHHKVGGGSRSTVNMQRALHHHQQQAKHGGQGEGSTSTLGANKAGGLGHGHGRNSSSGSSTKLTSYGSGEGGAVSGGHGFTTNGGHHKRNSSGTNHALIREDAAKLLALEALRAGAGVGGGKSKMHSKSTSNVVGKGKGRLSNKPRPAYSSQQDLARKAPQFDDQDTGVLAMDVDNEDSLVPRPSWRDDPSISPEALEFVPGRRRKLQQQQPQITAQPPQQQQQQRRHSPSKRIVEVVNTRDRNVKKGEEDEDAWESESGLSQDDGGYDEDDEGEGDILRETERTPQRERGVSGEGNMARNLQLHQAELERQEAVERKRIREEEEEVTKARKAKEEADRIAMPPPPVPAVVVKRNASSNLSNTSAVHEISHDRSNSSEGTPIGTKTLASSPISHRSRSQPSPNDQQYAPAQVPAPMVRVVSFGRTPRVQAMQPHPGLQRQQSEPSRSPPKQGVRAPLQPQDSGIAEQNPPPPPSPKKINFSPAAIMSQAQPIDDNTCKSPPEEDGDNASSASSAGASLTPTEAASVSPPGPGAPPPSAASNATQSPASAGKAYPFPARQRSSVSPQSSTVASPPQPPSIKSNRSLNKPPLRSPSVASLRKVPCALQPSLSMTHAEAPKTAPPMGEMPKPKAGQKERRLSSQGSDVTMEDDESERTAEEDPEMKTQAHKRTLSARSAGGNRSGTLTHEEAQALAQRLRAVSSGNVSSLAGAGAVLKSPNNAPATLAQTAAPERRSSLGYLGGWKGFLGDKRSRRPMSMIGLAGSSASGGTGTTSSGASDFEVGKVVAKFSDGLSDPKGKGRQQSQPIPKINQTSPSIPPVEVAVASPTKQHSKRSVQFSMASPPSPNLTAASVSSTMPSPGQQRSPGTQHLQSQQQQQASSGPKMSIEEQALLHGMVKEAQTIQDQYKTVKKYRDPVRESFERLARRNVLAAA